MKLWRVCSFSTDTCLTTDYTKTTNRVLNVRLRKLFSVHIRKGADRVEFH